MKNKLTWTVEISVGCAWIEDGFTLKEDILEEAILTEILPFAYHNEVKVKITTKPAKKEFEAIIGKER